jgi:hypothetical protein
MDSSRLAKKKLRISSQTDEKMLDNQEDNGRIVFVMKQANNSLFLNR